jgi:hypothetical protein
MYPFGVGSNGGSRPTERRGSVFSVAGICVVSVGAIASLYASIPQECKIASSALQFTLDVAPHLARPPLYEPHSAVEVGT